MPEIVYRRESNAEWLTFSAQPGSDGRASSLASRWLDDLETLLRADRGRYSVPAGKAEIVRGDDSGWSAPIDRALADIRAGLIDKVVLARRVRFEASRPLNPGRVLDALEAGHEDCARFAVTRPGFALLGVSPERLLSVRGDTVVTDALAGTAPRGATDEADRELAVRLRNDAKALEEHRIVVNQIRAALDPDCGGLVVPQAPDVMSLPTVHHLWSPVHGHLRNGSGLLELARRLHPTPAVTANCPSSCAAASSGSRRSSCSRAPASSPSPSPPRRWTRQSGNSAPCAGRWISADTKGAPAIHTGELNLRAAAALLRGLAAGGVSRAVISPGSRSSPLALAAERSPLIDTVVLPDERSAAFFALGRARVERRPVLVIATSGTAPANWFGAVIEASMDAVPLVLVSADRPPELLRTGANQTIDQDRMFGGFPRDFLQLPVPETASLSFFESSARRAAERARWPRPGPVHVNAAFRQASRAP